MRLYIIILPFFLLLSCGRFRNNESINELVLFGYPGFYRYDSCGNRYIDTTRLDIRLYIDVKRNQPTEIIRRKYQEENHYFTMNLSESRMLMDSINFLLHEIQLDSEYYYEKGSIYDAWFYTIYYKIGRQQEITTNYIPEISPIMLQKLHNLLIKKILASTISSNKFQYNEIVAKTTKYLFERYPPIQPNKQRIKYIAPVIVDTTKMN